MFGASRVSTGNLGVPTLHELLAHGHDVTCFIRCSEDQFARIHPIHDGTAVLGAVKLFCDDACDASAVGFIEKRGFL